jgi:hypothetical protein
VSPTETILWSTSQVHIVRAEIPVVSLWNETTSPVRPTILHAVKVITDPVSFLEDGVYTIHIDNKIYLSIPSTLFGKGIAFGEYPLLLAPRAHLAINFHFIEPASVEGVIVVGLFHTLTREIQ